MKQLTESSIESLYHSGQLGLSSGKVVLKGKQPKKWNTSPTDKAGKLGEAKIITLIKELERAKLIDDYWTRIGGPKSQLGLPLEGADKLQHFEGKTHARFRGGELEVSDDGTTVILRRIIMKTIFRGLECQVRQEKSDEIYAVITAIGPSNGTVRTLAIPGNGGRLSMGRPAERIYSFDHVLYEGPPEDITLVVCIVEHDDFANVKEASERIARQVAEKAGQLLSGLLGVPAEAIAKETWFQDGLGSALNIVLGGILGMGDDPFMPAQVRIPWHEGVTSVTNKMPPRTRPLNPHSIRSWTHKVDASGTDDGGDLGVYSSYFDFELETVEIKVAK